MIKKDIYAFFLPLFARGKMGLDSPKKQDCLFSSLGNEYYPTLQAGRDNW